MYEDADAVAALVDETVRLFHRLRAVSEELHGAGEQSASRAGVLRGLARKGPQTVPEMARARPVSRQHIQTLVNGLLADGLVALEPNPAHASSRLVTLTKAGAAAFAEMDARERKRFRRIAAHLDRKTVDAARQTLASVREALEIER
jgi:DNA-binding MarR family transcriptional regulator